MFKKIILISLYILTTACTTVPITNRNQLSLVSDREINSLSAQQYRKVISSAKISNNRAQTQNLNRVGSQIAKAVAEFYRENGLRQNFQWEFNLIEDDKQINAWAMPGGKIAVYTGILPYTQNNTGLATVLGHEIAHVIAKHANERFSQQMLAQLGLTALSIAITEQPAATQNILMQAAGIGTQVGVLNPFSRQQESEADRIGLILMAKAGYDPRKAVDFWQRMSKSGKQKPPELLSTHPSDTTRLNNIKKYMNEALVHYKK